MGKLANELTWSVSRDRLFRTCRRAYYYHYYGSWGGWEDGADEGVRKLYVLKNITTLEMWGGSVVHDTIAEALRRFELKRVPIKAGELQARARQKLRHGWSESVDREWIDAPKKTNLHGLYYGNGRTLPRERTDKLKDRVYSCLAAFAESEILREVLSVSPLNWKPIDQLDSLVMDGLKVWCAVDFAFVDPAGCVRIADWKTGHEDVDSLRLQLACYAFYAREKWFVPAEKLRVAGVFLREGARCSEYPIGDDMLVEARDRILAGAADMRALLTDVETNAARVEDFPLSDDDRPCRRCNFREVCPRFAQDTTASAQPEDLFTFASRRVDRERENDSRSDGV